VSWDIAGHAAAVASFQTALAAGRVGHAYIISGQEGIGKAHLAKLLGQALLCSGAPAAAPCGECDNCHRVASGHHPDVHWLVPDGASIRIEQVRALQSTLALRPFSAKYKVCIIDGADLMTEQAQNSMLKSLEEPPGDGVLILVTSRPSALLPTILSRCQMVRLQPLAISALAEYLQLKRGYTPVQARLVAALCAGRCGRALAADPEALIAQRDKVADWVAALRKERLRGALRISYELDKDESLPETLDMAAVWFADIWHVWLAAGLPIVNEDNMAVLEREAPLWREQASVALAALSAARRMFQQNANRRLVLDIMLMKMQRGLI